MTEVERSACPTIRHTREIENVSDVVRRRLHGSRRHLIVLSELANYPGGQVALVRGDVTDWMAMCVPVKVPWVG